MEASETADRILASSSTRLGQCTRIEIDGAVDVESTARLDAQFAEAACASVQPVILDMSGLRLTDEAAISSVLRGMDTLRSARADLDIRYPSPMALQLFELCRVLQIAGTEFAPASPLSDGHVASSSKGTAPHREGGREFRFGDRTSVRGTERPRRDDRSGSTPSPRGMPATNHACSPHATGKD